MTDNVHDRASCRAHELFLEGHNCCQATLQAVTEAHGLGCDCIPGIGLAMGGGLGHTGRACGAVTGAVLAIGLAADRHLDLPQTEKKQQAYALAAPLVRGFAERFGTTSCGELLGLDWSEPGAVDRFWGENMRDTKCMPLVEWAAAEASRIVARLATDGG